MTPALTRSLTYGTTTGAIFYVWNRVGGIEETPYPTVLTTMPAAGAAVVALFRRTPFPIAVGAWVGHIAACHISVWQIDKQMVAVQKQKALFIEREEQRKRTSGSF
jgi:hypothetical protein